LNKKNIYLEKTDEHIKQYKFTMPNLKPGSIIEWKYTLVSKFFSQLDRVVIQYDIPVKKEYMYISIPDFLRYRPHRRGSVKYRLQMDSKLRAHRVLDKETEGLAVIHNYYQYKENIYIIDLSDVPALHDEPYSGNIENYRTAIIFELAVEAFPNTKRIDYAITWKDVAKDAYEDKDFGKQLENRNYIKSAVQKFKKQPNDKDKLKAVFELAKQKIKWNHKYDYYVDDGVIKAYNKGSGNVAEVNLNLINMLTEAGFKAYPVLVSTIEHGVPVFPTRTGFNYVIAAVDVGYKRYLLDATEEYTSLNFLPERVLNFEGKLIKKDGKTENIYLFPKEHSLITSTINVNFDEEELSGTCHTEKDKYFAYSTRQKILNKSSTDSNDNRHKKDDELEVTDYKIKNLNDPYQKLIENFAFTTDAYTEEISDKIFIEPLMSWSFDVNPFKSEKREFPVFFNYPRIQSYTVNITIPEKYEIVSIPQPATYSFNNKEGIYEYEIKQQGNKIRLESKYFINTPIVAKEAYQDLKTFVDKVIKKQHEKIILKKK